MNVWEWVWMIGVYLAVACCLWAIFRIGVQQGSKAGIINLLVFILFAVIFWLLESWANVRAPFYIYPPHGPYPGIFPDVVPHFPWSSAFNFAPADDVSIHPCVQAPSHGITASVPLSAAVITFCLMWTARLLLDKFWTQNYRPIIAPFMVGLVALFLDLLLDPVLSVSHGCVPDDLGNMIYPVEHAGLGYWRWFADASLADTWWYEIPIFNFAVWFSFPVCLVALVVLFTWLTHPTTIQDLALRSVVAFGFGVIAVTSPTASVPAEQIAMVMISIAVAVYIISRDWDTYKRDNEWRWEFILPVVFYFLYSLAALLFAAAVPFSWPLLAAGVLLTVLGIVFLLAPYQRWP